MWEFLAQTSKGHATVEFKSISEHGRVWSQATQEHNTMTLAGPKPGPHDMEQTVKQ